MPDGDVEIAKRGMGILYGDDFAKSEADNAVGQAKIKEANALKIAEKDRIISELKSKINRMSY